MREEMSNSDIVLETKGISRTYQGRVPVLALKPCSLTFRKGEFTAIIGKSGSGKSTLLRILGMIDLPDEGELYWQSKKLIAQYKATRTTAQRNKPLRGRSRRELTSGKRKIFSLVSRHIAGEGIEGWGDSKLSVFRRRNIGFVYQDYNLFPEYTAYENIIMPIHLDGRREAPDKIEELMDKLGILVCKNKFPAEMSGGEQQRVSIARALATEPAVVLADEPTGNLDAENAGEVAGILQLASEVYQQTIIMVTHDQQMAEYADRIIRISDGVVSDL